ncbi:MAG: hypothetical protein NUV76_12430 [Candidatus Kuenenia sp.]|nr:hypothetical protein [Candidatus Kuenenia sp.]
MAKYKADNGKIVETDTMEHVLNMDYHGGYGNVQCDLYRTRKSHVWYKISESSWSGTGSISDAEVQSMSEVASMVARVMEVAEIQEKYPEISIQHLDAAIDA